MKFFKAITWWFKTLDDEVVPTTIKPLIDKLAPSTGLPVINIMHILRSVEGQIIQQREGHLFDDYLYKTSGFMYVFGQNAGIHYIKVYANAERRNNTPKGEYVKFDCGEYEYKWAYENTDIAKNLDLEIEAERLAKEHINNHVMSITIE